MMENTAYLVAMASALGTIANSFQKNGAFMYGAAQMHFGLYIIFRQNNMLRCYYMYLILQLAL